MTEDEQAAFARERPGLAGALSFTGMQDVFGSSASKLVFGLFALQLCIHLASRAPRMIAEIGVPRSSTYESMPLRWTVPANSDAIDTVARILGRRRFMVRRDQGGLSAVRNRFFRLGSLAFHLSLIVLLAGGWLAASGRFRGQVALAEGQEFLGLGSEYTSIAPGSDLAKNLPSLRFALERVQPTFGKDGRLLDIRADVRRLEERGRTADEIAINKPLRLAGASILMTRFDLAPVFSVRRLDNRMMTDFVCSKLHILPPAADWDSFRLSRPAATVRVRRATLGRGGPGHPPESVAADVREAALEVQVLPDDPGVSPVSGQLRPGDALAFGVHRLRLEETRTWALFQVTRDRGEGLLLSGFILMVAGAAARLLFPRAWVSARMVIGEGSSVLEAAGRAEWFQGGFRAELAQVLDQAARVAGTARGKCGDVPG